MHDLNALSAERKRKRAIWRKSYGINRPSQSIPTTNLN